MEFGVAGGHRGSPDRQGQRGTASGRGGLDAVECHQEQERVLGVDIVVQDVIIVMLVPDTDGGIARVQKRAMNLDGPVGPLGRIRCVFLGIGCLAVLGRNEHGVVEGAEGDPLHHQDAVTGADAEASRFGCRGIRRWCGG